MRREVVRHLNIPAKRTLMTKRELIEKWIWVAEGHPRPLREPRRI